MGFLDPYAVDGATITAAQLRRTFFQTVKGMTGVLGPDDLKVSAVPGSPGVVGIAPGSGSIAVQSRREAYQVTNDAMDGDALLTIPAAGSSAATWHIIVEVDDPQYHGQEPAARPRAVGSLSGLTRPYLYLASFSLPAGGAVGPTTSIVDRRGIAAPLELSGQRMGFPSSPVDLVTGANYTRWPDRAVEVFVPEWATHALVRAHLSGILGQGSAGRQVAGVRTYLGPSQQPANAQVGRELGEFGILVDEGSATPRRHHVTVVGRHDVRWARGTSQFVMTQGQKTEGSTILRADYQSTVSLEWTFVEGVV